jgi:outer membrane scaffolding protein for murein synthesis (MipA/OmpV family)
MPTPSTPAPASNISIDAGAAGIIVPRFPGSGKERFLPLPDIAVTVGDRFFASFADGIGANMYDRNGLEFGVLARPDLGRRASDTAHYLPGLSKVDFAPELGGFAQIRLTASLSLRAEVRKAIGGYDGVVADLALSWAKPVSKRLYLVVAPNLHIADARFMRAYFGVTAGAAAVGGLAAYQPGAGLERAGLRVVAVRQLGPRISLSASAVYDRLLGGAAHSPVVRVPTGSVDQPAAFISLRYHFR